MDRDDITLYGINDDEARELAIQSEQRQQHAVPQAQASLSGSYYEHRLKGNCD